MNADKKSTKCNGNCIVICEKCVEKWELYINGQLYNSCNKMIQIPMRNCTDSGYPRYDFDVTDLYRYREINILAVIDLVNKKLMKRNMDFSLSQRSVGGSDYKYVLVISTFENKQKNKLS